MKTLKILSIVFFMVAITACNKDDDNNPEPQPEAKRISTIHIQNSTGSESDYEITYTDFNKIASITYTEGMDMNTTTYTYATDSHRMESFSQVYSDGTTANFDILYDTDGNLTGIDDSGTLLEITETGSGFIIIVYGNSMTYTFNSEEQLIGIQNPTETTVFSIDANIKGTLHDVDVDRIFYVTDLTFVALFSKQGLNSINNFFMNDFYYTNTVDVSGYLLSSQIDPDPVDPTNDISIVDYTYIDL